MNWLKFDNWNNLMFLKDVKIFVFTNSNGTRDEITKENHNYVSLMNTHT